MKRFVSTAICTITIVSIVLGVFSFVGIASADTYTVTDLATLGGSTSSGIGINSTGEVVGVSQNASNNTHAFLYHGGSMHDLGTLSPAVPYYSGAYGINDSGDVVGTSMNASFANQAFFYDRIDGTMTAIDTLGGMTNDAMSINASGLVAGYSTVSGDSELHAYVYNSNTSVLTGIGELQDCVSSLAYAINDSGQVVGISLDSDAVSYAFLYDVNAGTMSGIVGQSNARGINNAGQVVGSNKDDVSGYNTAVMYDSDTGIVSSLGTLGGNTSTANGINAYGQIVGYSENSGGSVRAMIHSGGVMEDLNALAINMPAGWTLTTANGINDLGQIVCVGSDGTNNHAFLLTPIPEPSALILLATGLIGLLCYAWRKRK